MFKLNKGEILQRLESIVGKEYATNKPEDLYIYSQDPGASEPRPVDFVVMPKEVEEVQDGTKKIEDETVNELKAKLEEIARKVAGMAVL